MKTRRLQLLLSIVPAFILSSCGTYVSNNTLMRIQNGMAKHDVQKILGQPDYRRFDNQLEEWEYRTNIGLNRKVVILDFEDGVVCSMNSFADVSAPPASSIDVVPAPFPVDIVGHDVSTSINRNHGRVMSDKDFEQFYQSIKNEPFKDGRIKIISAATLNGRFLSRQCAKILSICSFDDERLTMLKYFAPCIEDRNNGRLILDSFTFSSNKDKASYMLESYLRR